MSTLQEKVGENIRRLRSQKGFSQEEFAFLTKIDRSYMGRIERGEANITIKVVEVIANALACQPAELLTIC